MFPDADELPIPVRCGDDSPDLNGSLFGGPIARWPESSTLRFFFFSDLLELDRSVDSELLRWLLLLLLLLLEEDEDFFVTVDVVVREVEDALICGTVIGVLVTVVEGNAFAVMFVFPVGRGIISSPELPMAVIGFSSPALPEGDASLPEMGDTVPSAGLPDGEPYMPFDVPVAAG